MAQIDRARQRRAGRTRAGSRRPTSRRATSSRRARRDLAGAVRHRPHRRRRQLPRARAATRCWPSRWSPSCATASGWTCRSPALFEAPTHRRAGAPRSRPRAGRPGSPRTVELDELLAMVEGLSPEEALQRMLEMERREPSQLGPRERHERQGPLSAAHPGAARPSSSCCARKQRKPRRSPPAAADPAPLGTGRRRRLAALLRPGAALVPLAARSAGTAYNIDLGTRMDAAARRGGAPRRLDEIVRRHEAWRTALPGGRRPAGAGVAPALEPAAADRRPARLPPGSGGRPARRDPAVRGGARPFDLERRAAGAAAA